MTVFEQLQAELGSPRTRPVHDSAFSRAEWTCLYLTKREQTETRRLLVEVEV